MPIVLKAPAARAGSPAAAQDVSNTVTSVIADVRSRGDAAVREYSARFDSWSPERFRLEPAEIERITGAVPEKVIADILTVQENVRAFARRQREALCDFEVETMPGVFLGQRTVPVSAVGAYVPGGRFPLLASAHMTIVTAKVAGVGHVTACTPPIRGAMPAATIAAMHLAGADEILILGGVQAVAAMALGTETISPVNMLVGPGNAFVAEAKRQLFGQVGIDLIAGPTEILVIADDQADPFTVAVDLLSQAEHGPDSPAILITTSDPLAREVLDHIGQLLPGMPTRDFAGPAWRDHGQVLVAGDLDEAYDLADSFAFEHVEVLTARPRDALDRLRNYGALFLGDQTCVAYGDKVIGTNHTLPTRGGARYTGGLWVGKYLKTLTYQEVRDPGSSAALGALCGRVSRVESFEGHARAGDVRAARYGGQSLPWAPQPAGHARA